MCIRLVSIFVLITLCQAFHSTAHGQVRDASTDSLTEDDLPADARALLTAFEAESQSIRDNADKAIAIQRESAIKQLNELQSKLNEQQKSDEALAIREKIRQLRISHLKARPGPSNLVQYSKMIGQTFYFDVTGVQQGSVWGTDAYTVDSSLAAAAVHAGVLKVGQKGMVRVTIINSPERHEGSEKNGITTHDYGPYIASFKIRRPLATDKNTTDFQPQPEIRIRSLDAFTPF